MNYHTGRRVDDEELAAVMYVEGVGDIWGWGLAHIAETQPQTQHGYHQLILDICIENNLGILFQLGLSSIHLLNLNHTRISFCITIMR